MRRLLLIRLSSLILAFFGLGFSAVLMGGGGGVGTPPVIENVYTASSSSGPASTLTVSSVVVSGANRALLVCGHGAGQGSQTDGVVNSVAFNTSESLTNIVNIGNGNGTNAYISFWYIAAPTATTADVVLTYPTQDDGEARIATVLVLTNAQQGDPDLFDTATCDACTNAPINLTSVVSKTLMVTCSRQNTGTDTWTHDAGQTEQSDIQEAGVGETHTTSTEIKLIAGTETLRDTASGAGFVRALAIGIKPAGA